MIKVWLKKYFAIVFMLATLLGSMHHHNDLKQHNNCQICTLQSSLSHADTPVDTLYLSDIRIVSEAIIADLSHLIANPTQILLRSRAPPKFS